jgi:predicted nucleic acid-binding protein
VVVQQELDLVCSFILRFENDQNPKVSNSDSISVFFDNAKEYIGSSEIEQLRVMISDFMRQGIKMKDATHLACAISAGCDYFITTDDKLLKKYSGTQIAMRTPITFLADMEEKKNA